MFVPELNVLVHSLGDFVDGVLGECERVSILVIGFGIDDTWWAGWSDCLGTFRGFGGVDELALVLNWDVGQACYRNRDE